MIWVFAIFAVLLLLSPFLIAYIITRDNDVFVPMTKDEIDKYYDTKKK